MTYKEFAHMILDDMTPEEQDCDVTAAVGDEYYAVTMAYTDEDCDVLDGGHPVLAPIR